MATNCLQQRWVFIHHVSAQIPNHWATEYCQNTKPNQCTKGDITALTATMNLEWQHKGESVMAQWAHEMASHRGQDDTCHWAREWGTDLPLAMTTQVIQDCEVCAVVEKPGRGNYLLPTPEWIRGNLVELVGKLTILTHSPSLLPRSNGLSHGINIDRIVGNLFSCTSHGNVWNMLIITWNESVGRVTGLCIE